MDAKAKTIQDILYSPDQFLIPFFQRHYSWQVPHWHRLWDDLRALASDTKSRQHFLGPLVCTAVNHMPGDVPVYLLIDGQQRLTTLTVLLAALRDVASEQNLPDLAQQIAESFLVHRFQKDIKRYKVVPRTGDREVLFAVIDGKHDAYSRRDGIVKAYRFFRAGVSDFIQNDPEPKLRRLLAAATGQLSLVVVNIDGENPYEIFESLNSTGLPLEEADLIRNYVFMQVPLAEQTSFNERHWQPFESMFDETDGFPALSPTLFYRDYLMRNGDYSRKGATFVTLKETLRSKAWDPASLVKELRVYAGYELTLRRPASCPFDELAKSLRRIEFLKITTAHPLIMNLMSRRDAGTLTDEELLGCLLDLESFVIRRSICGESAKTYGMWFVEAVTCIKEAPRKNLQDYWLRRGWPDDETFTARMVDFSLYRREPSKCRAILETLEEASGHKEKIDLTQLSIEHVMPQSIADDRNGQAWQEMLGEQWAEVHSTWLDTIGNLTLTGYNPKLSNKPFDKKKIDLAKSNLQLNKHFVGLKQWNLGTIRSRGKVLARTVAQIWTRPSGATFIPHDGQRNAAADEETGGGEEQFASQEYWEAFLEVLSKVDPTLKPWSAGTRHGIPFPTGRTAAWFAVGVDEDDGAVKVELCFKGKFRESSLRTLEQERNAIEVELGCQTDWEYDKPCKVTAFLDAVRASDRSDWPRQHQWLAAMLKKFSVVIGPRIHTPEDGVDFKDLAFEYWTTFDKCVADQGSTIELDPAKRRGWRDGGLGSGVSLWMNCVPEENWVGVGLMFSGKKGLALFEMAKGVVDAMKPTVGAAIEIEEEGSDGFLASYLFANSNDRRSWTMSHEWLRLKLEEYRQCFNVHLKNQAESRVVLPK